MPSDHLTAGVARCDITPPVGGQMQGYMSRTEPSQGIQFPLLATALVLAQGSSKVVLLDCDLLGLDLPLAQQIRSSIGLQLNTPSSHVIVGCTHTHNGPSTVRGYLGGVHDVGGHEQERKRLDRYIDDLVQRLIQVALKADGRRCPSTIGSGKGQANVGINREERLQDGRVVIGRNPTGSVDHSVDVWRVDNQDGNPMAVLTGYAAHPTVMGYETRLLSPDYPGVIRQKVEKTTGALCLFLTGAAGNQSTIEAFQRDWSSQERLGGIIGCETARVFFSIQTGSWSEMRQEYNSFASLAIYHQIPEKLPQQELIVSSRQVRIPLQPLPSLKEATIQLNRARAQVQDLENTTASAGKQLIYRMSERWAEGVWEKVQNGKITQFLEFEMVAFRIADLALVAMPGEPFVEIGLRVKKRSKAKSTLFGGYCNGVLAYWPTPETITQGGMAVEAAVRTYNIPAPPVKETCDIIVQEAGQLLEELGL